MKGIASTTQLGCFLLTKEAVIDIFPPMERQQQPLEQQVISLGKREYYRYADHALTSDVPASFLAVSRAMTLDFFPEASLNDLAEMLLGQRFESEQEAWAALKYGETVAAIKLFHSDLKHDADGPIVTNRQLENLFLNIGVTVMNERPSMGFGVREIVENYFEEPVNRLRIDYFDQSIKADRFH